MMRIGELARATHESVKTLRYWHDEGVLDADRTASRYRTFAVAMVERVAFVRRAQALGFTLAEIREVLRLRDHGRRPCAHVLGRLERHLAAVRGRLRAMQALERELAARVERARADPAPPCDEGCVYIAPPPAAVRLPVRACHPSSPGSSVRSGESAVDPCRHQTEDQVPH